MLAYQVYVYDRLKGYELIGILPERRKDPKRITKESVLKWGRMVLGDGADNYNIIFTQITMDDTTRQNSKAGSEMALPLYI
jgi:hypothetical protein